MPASGTAFFDTNVLVYLASANAAKADRVESLLLGGGTISVQILNEMASVARRKMRMSWEETAGFVGRFRELLDVVPVTEAIHAAGLDLASRYQLSVYDGMVVAAALDAGCVEHLSEDMQHGMTVEKRLVIRDPFR